VKTILNALLKVVRVACDITAVIAGVCAAGILIGSVGIVISLVLMAYWFALKTNSPMLAIAASIGFVSAILIFQVLEDDWSEKSERIFNTLIGIFIVMGWGVAVITIVMN